MRRNSRWVERDPDRDINDQVESIKGQVDEGLFPWLSNWNFVFATRRMFYYINFYFILFYFI